MTRIFGKKQLLVNFKMKTKMKQIKSQVFFLYFQLGIEECFLIPSLQCTRNRQIYFKNLSKNEKLKNYVN